MSNVVESTGFIDGVWHAGDGKVVAVLLTLNPSLLESGSLLDAMDEVFSELTRADNHTMFSYQKRYKEKDHEILLKKIDNFRWPNSERPVCSVTLCTEESLESYIRMANDLESAKSKAMNNLPPITMHVPMPPVKKPRLDPTYVPEVYPGATGKDAVVIEVAIKAENGDDAFHAKQALRLCFPDMKESKDYNAFIITLSLGNDPDVVLNAIDAINKKIPADLSITVYDPTGHLKIAASMKPLYGVSHSETGNLVVNFDTAPDVGLRIRLNNAFPASLLWTSSTSFEISCSKDTAAAKDIAAALFNIVSGYNMAEPLKKSIKNFFRREPLEIPPRPDSKRYKDSSAARGALSSLGAVDVERTIQDLEEDVSSRISNNQIDKSDLENDKALRALAALNKAQTALNEVQAGNRKRVIKTRVFMLLLLVALAVAGWLAYKYEYAIFNRGYTTNVVDCSVPFGEDRLTGKRYITNEYRSLFGIRVLLEGNVKDVTKLDLPGDQITLLGINPKNGKWWRKNFTKGDMGAEPLKPTDQYWFVGPKNTATVSYKNFCVKG